MHLHSIHCTMSHTERPSLSEPSPMVRHRQVFTSLGQRPQNTIAQISSSLPAWMFSVQPQPCTTTSPPTAMPHQTSLSLASAMLTTHGPTCFVTPFCTLSLRSGLQPQWITSLVTVFVLAAQLNYF